LNNVINPRNTRKQNIHNKVQVETFLQHTVKKGETLIIKDTGNITVKPDLIIIIMNLKAQMNEYDRTMALATEYPLSDIYVT
jgi:hypothetical protein